MAKEISETTRGVYMISPTPFDERGALDLKSTDSLLAFYVDKGVTGITVLGITVLGILGEATKLSPEESKGFLSHVLNRVGGERPVVVGVSNPGPRLTAYDHQELDGLMARLDAA